MATYSNNHLRRSQSGGAVLTERYLGKEKQSSGLLMSVSVAVIFLAGNSLFFICRRPKIPIKDAWPFVKCNN